MKRTFLLAFAFILASLSYAQDKLINDPNAEVREVSSFHAIKISNGIELIIKQGTADAVAVSAVDNEYRDRIITEVVDGQLKIWFDHKGWKGWTVGGKKLKAYVSFKSIDKIDGNSGSTTTIDGLLSATSLRIDLASGASLRGEVSAESLLVDQSSGATSKISGKVDKISVESSSGAQFDGYDLVSDICDADVSSGGQIHITVNKELSADASSGGGIRYKGGGVVTKVSTGSGGSIRKNG